MTHFCLALSIKFIIEVQFLGLKKGYKKEKLNITHCVHPNK